MFKIILILSSLLMSSNPIYASDKNIICIDSGCSGFVGPLFQKSNAVPGEFVTKTISIKNEKSEDIKVRIRGEEDGNANPIFLDYIQIEINDTSVIYSGNMNSYFSKEDIDLGTIPSGSSQNYKISLALNQNAPNEIQGNSVNFSLILTIEGIESGQTQSMVSSSKKSNTPGTNSSNSGSVLGIASNSSIGQILGLSTTSTIQNSTPLIGILLVSLILFTIRELKRKNGYYQ